MLETPGLARHLASVTDDDDDDAPIGEASARYFDGAAERARLIARGVLRPASVSRRRRRRAPAPREPAAHRDLARLAALLRRQGRDEQTIARLLGVDAAELARAA